MTSQVCKGYGSLPLQTFDLNQSQSVSVLSDESPQFSQVGGFIQHFIKQKVLIFCCCLWKEQGQASPQYFTECLS